MILFTLGHDELVFEGKTNLQIALALWNEEITFSVIPTLNKDYDSFGCPFLSILVNTRDEGGKAIKNV